MATNRHLFTAAFLLGATGIVWSGIGFIDSSFVALTMTAVIGTVYLYGALELKQFRQATATLTGALDDIPGDLPELGGWLGKLHPSLRDAVRLRVEGERTGLPGPALTPYLVGLLVMLGMLGTFLGMVVTLKGAVFALEGTADLQAMRSALSVPVKGLGLAFGTSVAGVAGSAMLGLMSALARRERMQASQQLDGRIGTVLRRFSLSHQREQTFRSLQLQSQALPQVVDKLEAMMARMDAMNRDLSQRLTGGQEDFHSHIKGVYTGLAGAVDKSLRETLSQSAQAASDSIRPVVEAAMSGMAQESRLMHERVAGAVETQLKGVSERIIAGTDAAALAWNAAVKNQEQANAAAAAELRAALQAFNDSFEQRSTQLVSKVGEAYAGLQFGQAERETERQAAWDQSLQALSASLAQELRQIGAQTLGQQQAVCDAITESVREMSGQAQAGAGQALAETGRLVAGAEELMRSRIASETQWMEQHRERMDNLSELLRSELGALRDQEAVRAGAAAERLGELQGAVAQHLATLGTALEEPITRLIHTASEAPRAAAEVIGQLRQEISHSVARDNALLDERARIMETLNALLESINHASREQKSVIDSMVMSSAAALDATAGAFSENVAAESARLTGIADQVTGSAVEVASLSEALGVAVNAFSDANRALAANLERIEGAMDKTLSRSDEQLAYYVAQAREIIDLSMMSQKEIVEGLHRLPAKHLVIGKDGLAEADVGNGAMNG